MGHLPNLCMFYFQTILFFHIFATDITTFIILTDMKKDFFSRFTPIMLAVLMCGVTMTSCTFVADNAVNHNDNADSQEQTERTIWVLSDIHAMAPELLNSQYQADDATKDPKMLLYSTEILDKLVGDALSAKPDMMLITGDLTERGDQKSHELVANILGKLVSEGIKVVVIPGNHDVDNADGSTSPQQFAELYKDFGFNMAYAKDQASLSYACEPFDGLVLLCIDTATGSIGDSTMKWLLDETDKAHEKGKQVVVMQHHNVMEHYDGKSSLQKENVLKNYEEVADKMIKNGIHLVFSGHAHIPDIAQYRKALEAGVDSLVEVETGSLLTYPNGWRIIKVNGSFKKWDISTQYIKSIPSIADVSKVSYKLYKDALPDIMKNHIDAFWPVFDSYRHVLSESDLSEDILPTNIEDFRVWFMEGMGEQMCKGFLLHIAGNEEKNPEAEKLIAEFKDGMENMVRKRLVDNKVDEEKISVLMLFVSATHEVLFKPKVESLLTDTNQVDTELSSSTDDLNVVLNIGK